MTDFGDFHVCTTFREHQQHIKAILRDPSCRAFKIALREMKREIHKKSRRIPKWKEYRGEQTKL